MIHNLLMVAAGGAIGASMRFMTGHWVMRLIGPGFPWSTLIVNIVGSLAMGVIAVVMMERFPGSWGRWAPFAMTGVLGGFTTFSAFSLDAFTLFERGRYLAAAAYVGGSVALSITALLIGFYCTRAVLQG
jgi:CrcB protein